MILRTKSARYLQLTSWEDFAASGKQFAFAQLLFCKLFKFFINVVLAVGKYSSIKAPEKTLILMY